MKGASFRARGRKAGEETEGGGMNGMEEGKEEGKEGVAEGELYEW